jgi:hypothetical protein
MRLLVIYVVLFMLLVPATLAMAQEADSQLQTTYCNFADDSQVSVQYNNSGKSKEEPKNGKVWEPGGSAMTLYTQVPVMLNHVEIPVGAFSVYTIPNKKEWTLIVNKNVTAGSKYDEAQDLVRAPMELGDLSPPVKTVQIAMARMAAKTCTLRISYGTVGAQADFMQK